MDGINAVLKSTTSNPLPLIENNIRLLVLQTVVRRKIPRIKVRDLIIVERTPTSPRLILDERDVMPASQRSTDMPDDSVGVVDIRPIHSRIALDTSKLRRSISGLFTHISFLFWRHGWLNKGTHVETLEREIDRRPDFPGAFRARGAEALEVDDECVGGAGNGDLLYGFAVFLASRATP